MEEELDLRPYIRALLHRWWWVIGLGVVAAVLGYAGSLLSPVVYEASSVALITQPRYHLQFDARFTTQPDASAQKTLPILATSDGVLQEVVDAYNPPPDARLAPWSPAGLAPAVKAAAGRDPSMLVLRVQSGSPQASAAIANQWADVVVEKGKAIYFGGDEDATLEDQAAEARRTLDAANAELAEFQSRNNARSLQAQLDAQARAQSDYVSAQIAVADTMRDLQTMKSKLATKPSGQQVSAADSLTVLMLQARVFGAGETLPQLQIGSGETLSGMSSQEQIALLDSLISAMQTRPAELEAQRAALEPKILAMQKELQQAQSQGVMLTSRRDIAQETYNIISRKLDEASIASQAGNASLQVASYASAPLAPVSPRPLRNSALAGGVGLVLGVILVLAVEWWKMCVA